MESVVGIVDLFSGPGGLGEGFCSLRRGKTSAFEIDFSVEKDTVAHSTLRLRSFLRKFGDSLPQEYVDFMHGRTHEPDWSKLYPNQCDVGPKWWFAFRVRIWLDHDSCRG